MNEGKKEHAINKQKSIIKTRLVRQEWQEMEHHKWARLTVKGLLCQVDFSHRHRGLTRDLNKEVKWSQLCFSSDQFKQDNSGTSHYSVRSTHDKTYRVRQACAHSMSVLGSNGALIRPTGLRGIDRALIRERVSKRSLE